MRIVEFSIFTPLIFAFLVFGTWTYTLGATTLTSQQNADLQYFGLVPNIDGGEELLKRLYGGCDYNPYIVLETKYKGRQGAEITPHVNSGYLGGLTQGIDPALACRLTKLFEISEAKGCRPKITYGYRSGQEQANMCGVGRTGCLAAGKSCHQYGLAVDASSACIGWMRLAAPQFALVFPYYGDHIQCIEHPRANYSSCNRPCNGGLIITPDLSSLPSPSQVPNTYYVVPPGGSANIRDPYDTAPSGIFSNPVSYLSQTPVGTPTGGVNSPSTNPSANPNQPQICDPKFTCVGNTRSYRSSSCSSQVVQTCSAGCSINGIDCANATSSAVSSTSTASIGTGANIGSAFGGETNSNDNTNTNTAPSVSTLLNSLANMPLFSSTEVGTTAPATFVLNASTGDIEQLNAQGGTGSIAPGTITSIQPTGPQSFTSTGFTTEYTNSGTYSPQQVSAFQTILGNLKSSLLWALSVLNPFGTNNTQ